MLWVLLCHLILCSTWLGLNSAKLVGHGLIRVTHATLDPTLYSLIFSGGFLQVSIASPNEDELIAMANALSCANVFTPIERGNKYSTESLFQKLKPAIWVLLEKGIRIVVVTLGSAGAFLCSSGGPSFMRTGLERIKPHGSSGQFYKIVTSSCPPHWYGATNLEKDSHLFAVHFPALPSKVVRLTGAGDCLVGGTLASICAGLNVMQSVAVGIAAAKASVEAEANVPTAFNLATIAGKCSYIVFTKLNGNVTKERTHHQNN
jgi:hypothetical protein